MMRVSLTFLGLALVAGCDCGGGLIRDRDSGRLDAPGTDGPRPDVPGLDAPELGVDGGGSWPPEIVVIDPSAPADAPSRFDDPMAGTPGPAVLYPLNDALVPRNVFSPDVQWEPVGAMGDLFRITIEGSPTRLVGYVGHGGAAFEHDWLVRPDAWRTLATADAGTTVTFRVDRWQAATSTVHVGAPISLRIARGSIAGAVYYWTLGSFSGTEGRIVRVRQGTDVAPAVENFLPQPTAAPDGDRCAACHSLSRDGNRLAVALDDGTFGGVYDLTVDLTGADPPMVFRFDQPWFFAAFDPTGTRLVMTDPSQGTHLLNGMTGAEITPMSGPMRSGTHPAWSPDGMSIAIVINADDAWNPTTGDLASVPVLGTDRFGAAGLLHGGSTLSGAPEGGTLDAYPTYSPDSSMVVFQHGTRTLVTAAGATGALYAIPRAGGSASRLTAATGPSAFYPNFTPFTTPSDTGPNVFWVLLYSRRDYGNELAGTRGTGRRQIWVAAVSTALDGGDPSFAPYWLPGQEVEEENASAYWAPIACRANGQGCTIGGQCCSERCGGTGSDMVCMPPPECRNEGETCSVAADCCETGAVCAGGVCLATVF
jgi:hypothetical protein